MTRIMPIKYLYGIIESSNLDWPSSIRNPLTTILNFPSSYLKHPASRLNSLSSTLLPAFSVKNARCLTQNVLKIAEFLIKCPQAPLIPLVPLVLLVPLVPLAAFSRSARKNGPRTTVFRTNVTACGYAMHGQCSGQVSWAAKLRGLVYFSWKIPFF